LGSVATDRCCGRRSRGRLAPVRTLIVAQTRLFREGLADALRPVVELDVVGTARSAQEAWARIAETRPALALVDTGGADGVALVSALAGELPVVALAVPEHEAEIVTLAEAGVAGYVTREAALADVVAAATSVARGETLCSPRVAATLFRRVAALAAEARRREAAELPHLTHREQQIIDLIEAGLSNKEIASRLQIEFATAKNHVHNILEKLQVARRADAVARVRDAG
jgi:two-component system, NarL family, nitrate/nitrite response regulator NarL